MLRKANDLIGYTLYAKDDNIGEVDDFYFSTEDWTIRYMVVDIGNWFMGRRVLIVPSAMGTPNWEQKVLPVDLTKEQVKDSPDIDLAQPIAREHEASLYSYYGWPTYWATPGALAMGMSMRTLMPSVTATHRPELPDDVAAAMHQTEDRHLQSMREVTGSTIEATDGSIGQVKDFFVDDQNWAIRYLLIDTSQWLPGKRVILSPEWVSRLDWGASKLHVQVTKDQVKNSPEYDPNAAIDRDYESRLYQHYDHQTYW